MIIANRLFPLLLTLAFVGGLLLSVLTFYEDGVSKGAGETADINKISEVRQIPPFRSLQLGGGAITDKDLRFPALINLWASWCAACLYEHPIFVRIGKQDVLIYGINHKDQTDKAQEWLDEHGNPYDVIIRDENGKLGEALDVYGLPETLLVNEEGEIIVRHRGTLTLQVWREKFASRLHIKI